MASVYDLIKLHEGAVTDSRGRHMPYRCPADKLTIGYGRNLDANGISDGEAQVMLVADVEECQRILSDRVHGYPALDHVRRAVLTDMCFNLGWPRLSKFARMLTAVEAGQYREAAAEMIDSRWFDQVGSRAQRLVRMMETGEWPEDVA